MERDVAILWGLYEEHCQWERHHEEQRASATNLMIAVAAAVLGVVTYDGRIAWADLPPTLFLATQGVFGSVFVAKQYERFAMHQRRAGKYREAIDRVAPELGIRALRSESDQENDKRFPRLHKVRLHRFWTALHASIAAFGFILTIGILAGWFS